jgi:diguanylate cyclase (GGDEF)-like protein
VYAWLTQAGTYHTGNPVDIGWVVAYVLIALAALGPDATADATVPAEGSLVSVVLPYVVVGFAFAVVLLAIVADRAEDPAMEACAALLCALVIGRQLLILVDNRRLHARLHDKVAELGTRERELEHLAFLDPLTGLANRRAFLERVDTAVGARASAPAPLSVLFVDLDDFKAVNDTLGHEAGDELLAEAASRLRSRVGTALAARLGGDEFGILVEGNGPEPPTALADRIHEAFRSPFPVGGRQMLVRTSIGIAHTESGHVPGQELLRQADIAMYAAKRRGKGSSQVFGPDLGDGATERVLLRSALASALGSDAFDLHYQPIVELVSGRVWGVEALSRWTDGERGSVPPAEFIPLSEETGLIHDLGRWVLKKACAEAVTWPGGSAAPLLSVNVSATQLQDAAIVGTVSDALAASGLPAERLMVEVSESLLMAQGEPFHSRLATMRELGVRVAIDNFGTGYSSLRHLPRFPVDVIKIDQSLIRGIDDGASGLAVLRAIVELADQLGLDTVAEGIEEIRQADALASVGCRSGQGYWYRRPVPAASLWPMPTGSVLRPKQVAGERATFPPS